LHTAGVTFLYHFPLPLSDLVARHGYAIVAIVIGLESMGIPMPGETMLVSAAIYAGTTHHLNIALVILWATIGAVIGDNAGYLIGRRFGYPLLLRYGYLLRINESRIKLGELLFRRHGGKVVLLGRFVALLRALAALLAGMNRMPWQRFLLCNAAGAILWAGTYGLAAYSFGEQVMRFGRHVSVALVIAAALGAAALFVFLRRHEAALEAEAEREIPGPLHPTRRP
jgi:membrane protein DedA with SNARE-associated domain